MMSLNLCRVQCTERVRVVDCILWLDGNSLVCVVDLILWLGGNSLVRVVDFILWLGGNSEGRQEEI